MKIPVSLITTVKNESSNIYKFIESISKGSHIPSEFIIVDSNSDDSTPNEIIRASQSFKNLNIKYINGGNINIAAGRNLAISQTSFEIIAVTDAGCIVSVCWLESICRPIIQNLTTHVAGWYEPLVQNEYQKKLSSLLFPSLSSIDCNFLPSSRSIAFRKDIFLQVGKYPEWLSFAAEDTLFSKNVRTSFGNFYFERNALVFWEPPINRAELLNKYFKYGVGEGEAFINLPKSILRILSLLLPIDLILDINKRAMFIDIYLLRVNVSLGYIKGMLNRFRLYH